MRHYLRRYMSVIAPDLTKIPLESLISLSGQTAVVTGGARGIGKAIVDRLAEAGATVYATDAAPEPGSDLVALDVTESTAVAALTRQVIEDTGRLDVWVNNAGLYPSQPLLEMTDADWDAVLDVNLKGAFVGAREAARQMVEAGNGGIIINIASVSGYRGRKTLAHYSSSKHGLRGLTRSLAVELGEYGIRSLAIAPTMIVTPGTQAATPAGQSGHSTDVYSQLPLGRPGVPDDVARVALFCASPLAAFMTGSTLAVDAGQMSM
jgi:NAD(P)-dependent dehydrogenase (short-subunit alcohol dehydrogenase family)